MANKNSNYSKDRPKYEWGTGWCSKDITEKQVQYLEKLADKVGLRLQNLDQLKRGGASGLIDELKRVADYGESTRYLQRDWSKYVIL